MTSIRVWSEFLPYSELREPAVTDLLSEFDVGLNVSVHGDQAVEEVADLLAAYGEAGIDVALWVLLPKSEGYFPSGWTFDAYRARVRYLMNYIEKRGLPMPHIAVDLEPPLYIMEGNWLKSRDRMRMRGLMRRGLSGITYDKWTRRFSDLDSEIKSRGARTLVAASFTVADDIRRGEPFTQAVTATPTTGVDWDAVSIMWYVSMAVGLSRGLVSYDVARYQLYRDCATLRGELGPERASVSLGVTWTGVLGNEPYYESADDLVPDVQAAKAAGIGHIWLYNLEGVLKAVRPEKWFEVIRDTKPLPPEEGAGSKVSSLARAGLMRAAKWYFG